MVGRVEVAPSATFSQPGSMKPRLEPASTIHLGLVSEFQRMTWKMGPPNQSMKGQRPHFEISSRILPHTCHGYLFLVRLMHARSDFFIGVGHCRSLLAHRAARLARSSLGATGHLGYDIHSRRPSHRLDCGRPVRPAEIEVISTRRNSHSRHSPAPSNYIRDGSP